MEQVLGVAAAAGASSAAAGGSVAAAAGGGRGKVPLDFDPYWEEPYVPPPNPYDTSIVDSSPEVPDDEVGSDDESFHIKTRHVLRRLEAGTLDDFFCRRGSDRPVYRCPFCTRHLQDMEFNTVCRHAESLGSYASVGSSVNVYAFMAN